MVLQLNEFLGVIGELTLTHLCLQGHTQLQPIPVLCTLVLLLSLAFSHRQRPSGQVTCPVATQFQAQELLPFLRRNHRIPLHLQENYILQPVAIQVFCLLSPMFLQHFELESLLLRQHHNPSPQNLIPIPPLVELT